MRRNSTLSSLRRKKMYSYQIIQCIWLVRIASFDFFLFNWNSECEMQTFRIKLIQRYTQVYQLATKQQIWGPNTHLDSSVPFWSLRKVQNQRVTAWSKHKICQVQGSAIWWNPASIPQVVFSKCQRPKMEFISRRINSTIWFW